MAAYFDPADPVHLEMIPQSVQQADDFGMISEIAEAEVIAMYTGPLPKDYPVLDDTIPYGGVRLDDYRYVYLRDFEIDADDANTGADLKVALRRTIARVIPRFVRMWDKDDRLTSDNNGRNQKTFRATGAQRFPKGWDSLLRAFDTRPVPYVL